MTRRSSSARALASASFISMLLLVACDPATGESECGDGIDNDLNGRTDCDDLSCATHPECTGSDGGTCGPESCMGCCDGDRCVSGESLAACGLGGGACEACPLGATCEATGCEGGPVACGPGNCTGCCMGDICIAGDRPAACGAGGGACAACETWEICDASACGVDPASEWQISLLDATIPDTNFGGASWDAAGDVDPFVELRVGSAGATPTTMPTIDGSNRPDWTMGGTTMTLSPRFAAAEILAFLRFDMFDEDVSLDDAIGTCRYMDTASAFNGEVVTFVCEPNATLEHVGFTLRWQLVPG